MNNTAAIADVNTMDFQMKTKLILLSQLPKETSMIVHLSNLSLSLLESALRMSEQAFIGTLSNDQKQQIHKLSKSNHTAKMEYLVNLSEYKQSIAILQNCKASVESCASGKQCALLCLAASRGENLNTKERLNWIHRSQKAIGDSAISKEMLGHIHFKALQLALTLETVRVYCEMGDFIKVMKCLKDSSEKYNMFQQLFDKNEPLSNESEVFICHAAVRLLSLECYFQSKLDQFTSAIILAEELLRIAPIVIKYKQHSKHTAHLVNIFALFFYKYCKILYKDKQLEKSLVNVNQLVLAIEGLENAGLLKAVVAEKLLGKAEIVKRKIEETFTRKLRNYGDEEDEVSKDFEELGRKQANEKEKNGKLIAQRSKSWNRNTLELEQSLTESDTQFKTKRETATFQQPSIPPIPLSTLLKQGEHNVKGLIVQKQIKAQQTKEIPKSYIQSIKGFTQKTTTIQVSKTQTQYSSLKTTIQTTQTPDYSPRSPYSTLATERAAVPVIVKNNSYFHQNKKSTQIQQVVPQRPQQTSRSASPYISRNQSQHTNSTLPRSPYLSSYSPSICSQQQQTISPYLSSRQPSNNPSLTNLENSQGVGLSSRRISKSSENKDTHKEIIQNKSGNQPKKHPVNRNNKLSISYFSELKDLNLNFECETATPKISFNNSRFTSSSYLKNFENHLTARPTQQIQKVTQMPSKPTCVQTERQKQLNPSQMPFLEAILREKQDEDRRSQLANQYLNMAQTDPKLKKLINPLNFLKKPASSRRNGISNLDGFNISEENEQKTRIVYQGNEDADEWENKIGFYDFQEKLAEGLVEGRKLQIVHPGKVCNNEKESKADTEESLKSNIEEDPDTKSMVVQRFLNSLSNECSSEIFINKELNPYLRRILRPDYRQVQISQFSQYANNDNHLTAITQQDILIQTPLELSEFSEKQSRIGQQENDNQLNNSKNEDNSQKSSLSSSEISDKFEENAKKMEAIQENEKSKYEYSLPKNILDEMSPINRIADFTPRRMSIFKKDLGPQVEKLGQFRRLSMQRQLIESPSSMKSSNHTLNNSLKIPLNQLQPQQQPLPQKRWSRMYSEGIDADLLRLETTPKNMIIQKGKMNVEEQLSMDESDKDEEADNNNNNNKVKESPRLSISQKITDLVGKISSGNKRNSFKENVHAVMHKLSPSSKMSPRSKKLAPSELQVVSLRNSLFQLTRTKPDNSRSPSPDDLMSNSRMSLTNSPDPLFKVLSKQDRVKRQKREDKNEEGGQERRGMLTLTQLNLNFFDIFKWFLFQITSLKLSLEKSQINHLPDIFLHSPLTLDHVAKRSSVIIPSLDGDRLLVDIKKRRINELTQKPTLFLQDCQDNDRKLKEGPVKLRTSGQIVLQAVLSIQRFFRNYKAGLKHAQKEQDNEQQQKLEPEIQNSVKIAFNSVKPLEFPQKQITSNEPPKRITPKNNEISLFEARKQKKPKKIIPKQSLFLDSGNNDRYLKLLLSAKLFRQKFRDSLSGVINNQSQYHNKLYPPFKFTRLISGVPVLWKVRHSSSVQRIDEIDIYSNYLTIRFNHSRFQIKIDLDFAANQLRGYEFTTLWPLYLIGFEKYLRDQNIRIHVTRGQSEIKKNEISLNFFEGMSSKVVITDFDLNCVGNLKDLLDLFLRHFFDFQQKPNGLVLEYKKNQTFPQWQLVAVKKAQKQYDRFIATSIQGKRSFKEDAKIQKKRYESCLQQNEKILQQNLVRFMQENHLLGVFIKRSTGGYYYLLTVKVCFRASNDIATQIINGQLMLSDFSFYITGRNLGTFQTILPLEIHASQVTKYFPPNSLVREINKQGGRRRLILDWMNRWMN